jgi:hypothetical protein
MMRKLILTALLALAVPAGALAADQAPDDLAKAACKSEKAKMGTKTFTATYAASGASRATEACVAKRDGRAATDLKNAAKACKAERAADAVVGGGGGWSPRAQSTRSASASWPAAARRRPPRGRTARTGGRYMAPTHLIRSTGASCSSRSASRRDDRAVTRTDAPLPSKLTASKASRRPGARAQHRRGQM